MTAVCSGSGSSSPKSGIFGILNYGIAVLANLLTLRTSGWLKYALPFIPIPSIDVDVFCASDPPAMPTLTTAEADALLNVKFGSDFDSGAGKFKDALLNMIWYEICKCDAGAAPTVPSGPVAPTDAPIYIPPTPVPTSACASIAPQGLTASSGSGPTFISQMGRIAYVGGPILNVTSTRVTMKNVVHTAPGVNVFYRIYHQRVDSTTTTIADRNYTLTPSQTVVVEVPWPVEATVIRCDVSGFSGSGSTDYTVGFEQFCNGDRPGAEIQGCCPPDVATQTVLDAILAMVTLIQRQIVPFAYVTKATHAGLTGAGQIAVNGLLGVAVDLTVIPGRVGSVDGNPDTLYDIGWINTGTPDGWGPRYFISSDPFILKPISGDVTLVGYSLEPGVTATIKELAREP